MSVRWAAGMRPSEAALARMEAHFPKPSLPMGEAWFMSERRVYYTELVERPLSEIPISDLEHVLYEISSGIKCFGHRDEWEDWFRYLLPRLIPRIHETYVDGLLEGLTTAFIQVYWDGIRPEYDEFRDDVLNTLPVALLSTFPWGKDPSAELQLVLEDVRICGVWDISGRMTGGSALSSALVFMLKYLTPDELQSWVETILEISSHAWRIVLLVWILHAARLLRKPIVLPKEFEKSKLSWPDCSFGGTHPAPPAFNDDHGFLPHQTRLLFLDEFFRHLPVERYFEWMEPFLTNDSEDIPIRIFFQEFFDEHYG